MKAYVRTQNVVSNKVVNDLVKFSQDIANKQSDDISARVINEMVRAMYDCDISKDKIKEVVEYHAGAIIPLYAQYRVDGLGDLALKTFCSERGLPYVVCSREL